MNMHRKIINLLVSLILPECVLALDIDVVVIDAMTQKPKEGVTVSAIFPNPPRVWGGSSRDEEDEDVSDQNGMCHLSGNTTKHRVDIGTEDLGGYYKTEGAVGFPGSLFVQHQVVTLLVQRVISPIPLAVKRVECNYGENLFEHGGGQLQFDMVKGEYLPPIGTGEVADVIFTRLPREGLQKTKTALGGEGMMYKDKMKVEFVGKGNGLIAVDPLPGSKLRVRHAPKDAILVAEYTCWKGRDAELQYVENIDNRHNWCFRIRTQYDEQGTMTNAFWGKLYGDIGFASAKGKNPTDGIVPIGSPDFLYYLNLTPMDGNLEFDQKHNLFPNIRNSRDFAP